MSAIPKKTTDAHVHDGDRDSHDADAAQPTAPDSSLANLGSVSNQTRERRQRRRLILKWLKRSFLLAITVALVVGLVFALLPKPIPVDVAEATLGHMTVTVREDGKTRVKHRYVISAPQTGNMLRITARPGDPVAVDEILARLVPTAPPLLDDRTRQEAVARLNVALASQRQARTAVSAARLALEHARSEAERYRALGKQGAIPQQRSDQAEFELKARTEDLVSAEFAVKVANHQVSVSRATLGRLEKKRKPGRKEPPAGEQLDLTSPVKGRVLRVFQESEAVVAPGTPLVEVGDPGALEVVADVLTRDSVFIEEGAPVHIERWGGKRVLDGRVRRVEPSAFTRLSALGVEEQRVNVVIEFDTPYAHWQALGDNYRVEVQIVIWRQDDVLTVPTSTVFRHGDTWAVYVIRDGLAHLTPVTIGRRNETQVQIVEGIEAGTRVILHPSDRVEDQVEVIERAR